MELAVRALWLLIKCLMIVALALLGAMFALRNDHGLSVDFILLRSPEISLGLWLLMFLAAGALLGILASSLIVAKYRRQLARFKKGTNKS